MTRKGSSKPFRQSQVSPSTAARGAVKDRTAFPGPFKLSAKVLAKKKLILPVFANGTVEARGCRVFDSESAASGPSKLLLSSYRLSEQQNCTCWSPKQEECGHFRLWRERKPGQTVRAGSELPIFDSKAASGPRTPFLRSIESWNSKTVGSEVPNRKTAGRLGCVAFAKPRAS